MHYACIYLQVRCYDTSDGCPVGTYPVTSGNMIVQFQALLSGQNRRVCFPCDPICARCTGPASTACTACSHATISLPDNGVKCVQSCIGNDNCFYCDTECNGCRDNATDCAGCRNDRLFWQGRYICVPSCDSSTYLHILPTGTAECAACDPQCNGCTGPTNRDCKACQNYGQPASDGSGMVCQDSCAVGYYGNGTSCFPCSRDCRSCNGPSNTQCFVCQSEDSSVNRQSTVSCARQCAFGYSLDPIGGDCDLNT